MWRTRIGERYYAEIVCSSDGDADVAIGDHKDSDTTAAWLAPALGAVVGRDTNDIQK